METLSRKRQKTTDEKKITKDRLSDLPDELVYLILSNLPIQTVAQTATLSKFWKTLWRSYPYLDFSSFTPGKTHHIMELLPNLLSLRASNSVKLFRVCDARSTSSCVTACLRRLSSHHHVEELVLDIIPARRCTLPKHYLFRFKNLKVLELSAGIGSFINFPELASKCFGSLNVLSLTRMNFLEEPFFSADTFPVIKTLTLKQCDGISKLQINCPTVELVDICNIELASLDINGAKLEELCVEYCFQWLDSGDSVRVIAPSMHSFFWIGNQIPSRFTLVAEEIKTAEIDFAGGGGKLSAQSLKAIAALWNVFSSTGYLKVAYRILEYLSNIEFAGTLPKRFSNLTSLRLDSGSSKDEIPGTINLLRSAPFLSTLDIHAHDEFEGYDDNSDGDRVDDQNFNCEQYLESHGGAIESFERHLTVVNIDINGAKIYDTTLGMIKFLLRHGQVLQKMTIASKMNPPLSKQAISSEIMKFERASSNVTISFT